MGAFEFTALDERGRERKGTLEGDGARQVRQQLRERNWIPLTVTEMARRPGRRQPAGSRLRRRLGATDLALLTRQLATLVQAGVPVEQALGAVARQSEKAHVKGLLLTVRARVVEGHPLAAALADHPRTFSELYRETVAAGEQSGHLDGVLERLADYTEARQQMGQKVLLALLYPLLLTLVAVAVVAGLLTYVVPQVVQVFTDMDQQLPALTRGLITASDLLRAHGALLLAALGGSGLLIQRLLRIEAIRRRWHRLLLRLPLIGRLQRGVQSGRFARTFAILAASGVPALESLRIAGRVLDNRAMREAVGEVAERVREGAPLARSLERTALFPPMTIHLIASGEASGRLDQMLERAATAQEREVETLIAALLGIFEPLLILLMGGMVLTIVAAILLPVFEMNQLVG